MCTSASGGSALHTLYIGNYGYAEHFGSIAFVHSKMYPLFCPILLKRDYFYHSFFSSTVEGKPKGVLRDNGGHAVALSWAMANIFGVKKGDVFWAASDIGWVVGHSFMVYGPLIHGELFSYNTSNLHH